MLVFGTPLIDMFRNKYYDSLVSVAKDIEVARGYLGAAEQPSLGLKHT